MTDEIIQFGKYTGSRLSDIPTSYLAWVCKTSMQKESYFKGIEAITQELKRRERKMTLEVTEHALLRAQQRLMPIYASRKRQGEKLKPWLIRVFETVLKQGKVRKSYKSRNGKVFPQPRYEYFLRDTVRGLEWKFVTQGNDMSQTLVTVYAPGYTDAGAKKKA